MLARDTGLRVLDLPVKLPELSYEWALIGLPEVRRELGDLWPECVDDLTLEIGFGLKLAEAAYSFDARARIETNRTEMNEAMASIFDQVDFVITASNPDIAFGAEDVMPPSKFNGVEVGFGNNGALTIPSNIYGNPAMSVPVGTSRGLPVGMQILAGHHREPLLLELAHVAERERPWPLVAPGAPV
jgi:aspartyl-tRNA(Asn)/glutamyl-tRNA(Gln) amidotransferase subunit A